ncbi:MAG: hypothetical protein Q7V88_17965 [Actinomycetota bacterium]|nr:hypothetical protein [Actinomycetota bacterium]
MNDDHDLEQRLRHLGAAPTAPLSGRAVHDIEARVLATPTLQRPRWVPLVAAAAAVLLLVGVALALRHDGPDTMQPDTMQPATTPAPAPTTDDFTSTTTSLASTSTSGAPSSSTVTTTLPTDTQQPATPTTAGAVPPTPPSTSGGPTTATTPATSPATTPATTVPATTVPPVQIPDPSFALQVVRVGDRLVFSWPQYTGADGVRYMLIRVAPGGLAGWPPEQARIAKITPGLGMTTTDLLLPTTERRLWVLVVVGENRRLTAVSTIAISR